MLCVVMFPLANVMARRELKYDTMEKPGNAVFQCIAGPTALVQVPAPCCTGFPALEGY